MPWVVRAYMIVLLALVVLLYMLRNGPPDTTKSVQDLLKIVVGALVGSLTTAGARAGSKKRGTRSNNDQAGEPPEQ